MSRNLTKQNPGRKERINRIAELRVQGRTLEEIGQEVGLHKSTVSRVLNDDETKALVEESALKVLRLVPQAVDIFAELMAGDDQKLRGKIADRVLQIAGISPSHAPAQVIQNIFNVNRSQSNRIQINAIGRVLDRNLGLEAPGDEDIIDAESDE